MIKTTIQITNACGVGLRASLDLLQVVQVSKSSVLFSCGDRTSNGLDIVSITYLCACNLSTVNIEVDGEDEKETMDKLMETFNSFITKY